MRRILRRLESRALLLWLAVAGAIWAFMGLGGEVLEGDTAAFDRRLLLMLRNPAHPGDPIGPRGFEESMRDMTALGGVTFLTLLTITATLVLALHGKRTRAAIFAATVILADVSSEVLKQVYGRPRPDLVPHGRDVYSASFPSGHSTMAAATFLTLATVIASLEPRRATKVLVYVIAAALIVLIGFSRVYLGVHWPSDVLAGWSLGTGWAVLAWIAINHFSRPAPERSG
jgi:undecaprenyl-diphosphatase